MVECLNAAKCGEGVVRTYLNICCVNMKSQFRSNSAALALCNLHLLRTLSDLITTGIKRHCQFIPVSALLSVE